MSPSVAQVGNTPPLSLSKGSPNVDLSVFPDGLKTSGQHPPLYDMLQPYSVFPKVISGQTVWLSHDYQSNPERWTHSFSQSELSELSEAADRFIASDVPLTGISKNDFILESMSSSLAAMRREILDGKGFVLYKNFPVEQWGLHKLAVAYIGLGCHMGYPVSQNGRGHILGHVKDLGEDSAKIEKVRIYRTNARQFFHADEADVVGLLCVARAEEGGESDVASVHAVWNVLQKERPDVAELFTQPIWYFDRKGEISEGEEPYIRAPVFYLETAAENSPSRVYCKWDPYNVRSLSRFSDKGEIPPLSAAQLEAMTVLEETCERLKLHMILEVGDIQFLSNAHVLHARTAYRDFAPWSGLPRRHLMRLWLSSPEDEGGWRLPFKDSRTKKRAGIQVDNTRPTAKTDAD